MHNYRSLGIRTLSAELNWRPVVGGRLTRNSSLPYLLVFLAAIAPRVILATFFPYDSLDWPIVYRVVAENIYFHGCVSQSPPLTAICAPHWGGNQLPGYPFLVALVWTIAGKSNLAVLLAQSVLTALGILWLTRVVSELTHSTRIATVVGLVLSLSPANIGWARSLNTEALSVAATIWVLAELLLSLARGRLRTWSLGCALACAVFLRYDNVVLCLLVMVCAFAIHQPMQAVRRGLVVALVLAAPLAIWSVRSVELGLPFPPSMNVVASINPDGSVVYPVGLKRYALSWIANATDMKIFTIPAYNGNYKTVHVPDSVFDSASERREVHSLETELSNYQGRRFPTQIDDALGAIATVRYAMHPWRQILWLPLERMKALWINPFYSWGLPIGFENGKTSMEIENQINRQGESALIQTALANPGVAIGKIVVNSYVFGLLAAFLLLVIATPFSPQAPHVRTIYAIALSLAFSRSLLMAAIAQVETRYIIDCIPAIEISVVIGGAAFWQRYVRWLGRREDRASLNVARLERVDQCRPVAVPREGPSPTSRAIAG